LAEVARAATCPGPRVLAAGQHRGEECSGCHCSDQTWTHRVRSSMGAERMDLGTAGRQLDKRSGGTESVSMYREAEKVTQGAERSVADEQLLWRWATDWRLGLTGLSNGILQLMLPGLGAGVAQHSDFFN